MVQGFPQQKTVTLSYVGRMGNAPRRCHQHAFGDLCTLRWSSGSRRKHNGTNIVTRCLIGFAINRFLRNKIGQCGYLGIKYCKAIFLRVCIVQSRTTNGGGYNQIRVHSGDNMIKHRAALIG